MLPQLIEKVKKWAGDNRADLFTSAMIFLIGIASFGLGRLSVSLPMKELISLESPASAEGQPADISSALDSAPASLESSPSPVQTASKNGSFVASKSGSVYYAMWCSGVSRIREENKVWFQTKEEAKAQGYRPAKNCPGL